MDDEDKPKTQAAHEVGMRLDDLSIGELEERIAVLEGEIERLRQAVSTKTASRSAADSVFKI